MLTPRKKQMVSFALDPELIRRLEAWASAQEVPPSKTAIIETAIRTFLDARETPHVKSRR
jgi:predicted transcriptional regulator